MLPWMARAKIRTKDMYAMLKTSFGLFAPLLLSSVSSIFCCSGVNLRVNKWRCYFLCLFEKIIFDHLRYKRSDMFVLATFELKSLYLGVYRRACRSHVQRQSIVMHTVNVANKQYGCLFFFQLKRTNWFDINVKSRFWMKTYFF